MWLRPGSLRCVGLYMGHPNPNLPSISTSNRSIQGRQPRPSWVIAKPNGDPLETYFPKWVTLITISACLRPSLPGCRPVSLWGNPRYPPSFQQCRTPRDGSGYRHSCAAPRSSGGQLQFTLVGVGLSRKFSISAWQMRVVTGQHSDLGGAWPPATAAPSVAISHRPGHRVSRSHRVQRGSSSDYVPRRLLSRRTGGQPPGTPEFYFGTK